VITHYYAELGHCVLCLLYLLLLNFLVCNNGISNDNYSKENIIDFFRSLVKVESLCCSYQLMEMCWHAIPGQRASLRELRIMLLHLRSAARDNPETSADFDQKWNQLMPRRAAFNHAEPRSTTVDIHTVSSNDLDVDLGTLSGSTRPVSFDSDFSEFNTSVSAQAGSLQPSIWSASVTPDSAGLASDVSYQRESLAVTSPINEMSLAAELGVFNRAFGQPDDISNDDDGTETFVTLEHGLGTPQLFNIHADVHSDGAYAVEYKSNDQELDCETENITKPSNESWNGRSNDLFDADTSENDFMNDISVEFSSLNEAQTAVRTQQYASYLQTVTTSVDGDDFLSLTTSMDKNHMGGNGVSMTVAVNDHPVEFDHYYKSLATDAVDVVASEEFLGDHTEFATYYSEQNVGGDHQDTATGSVA